MASASKTLKVLFFAASPIDQSRVGFEEEYRRLLNQSHQSDRLQFLPPVLATEVEDIERWLYQAKPQIVHFSMHGDQQGNLLITAASGQTHSLSTDALFDILRAYQEEAKPPIQLLVFNACFSSEQAEAIKQLVDYAVGMRNEISITAATAFSASFYATLNHDRSVKNSLDAATSLLKAKGFRLADGSPEWETPVLIVRDGVDPSKLVPAPLFPPDYHTWLLSTYGGNITMLGLDRKDVNLATMDDVYVPLTTPHAIEDLGERKEGRRPDRADAEKKSTLLLVLLDTDSVYVSGDAGTGKSWFCRWVTLLLCHGKVPTHKLLPPEEYREKLTARDRTSLIGRLPLLVPLREFWDSLPHTLGGDVLTRDQLVQSLAKWLDAKKPGGLTWSIVEAHLEQGLALLIFDGVDEVPRSKGEEYGVWQPHDLLISGLGDAIAHWRKAGNRILVTSRPYGLAPAEVEKLGLPEVRIGDLPDALQRLLVQRWFAVLERDPARACEIEQQLHGDLATRIDLQETTANPLFLTAVCVIYSENRRLPDDKYDLYRRVVDVVLAHRFPQKEQEAAKLRLSVVAYGMHTGVNLAKERKQHVAETDNDEIDAHLEAFANKDGFKSAGFETAYETRQTLLAKSGLLVPRSDTRSAFYHLSLQEYLAAERLYKVAPKTPLDWSKVFIDRAPFHEWHNALAFFFGALLKHEIESVAELLDQLTNYIDHQNLDETIGLQVVVGEALQLRKRKGSDLNAAWIDVMVRACLAAIAPGVTPQRRVPIPLRHKLGLALGALGELGDPRIVTDLRLRGDDAVATLPSGQKLSAWVKVDAGDYSLGAKDENDNQPHSFTLTAPIWLTRYPVTNSQFALFIADGGYEKPDLWWKDPKTGEPVGWNWREKEKITEPAYWGEAKWNGKNQPVVGVSWYEAEAFARWAGCRLPTEAEWEAAARGPHGYVYPWGNKWADERCNSSEAKLGMTSAVGLFPDSASQPFGLEDMAGNVLEWCADWYRKDHEKLDANNPVNLEYGSHRVIRGGSWFNYPLYCRCAARLHYEPTYRSSDLGFRVVRAR